MVMAAESYFRRITEDETAVTYLFGRDPETMTRRLVVDKATRMAKPEDGTEDGLFRHASGGIFVRHHATGDWPDRGLLQT